MKDVVSRRIEHRAGRMLIVIVQDTTVMPVSDFLGVPVIARLFHCVSPHYEFVWHAAVCCLSDAYSDAYSGDSFVTYSA